MTNSRSEHGFDFSLDPECLLARVERDRHHFLGCRQRRRVGSNRHSVSMAVEIATHSLVCEQSIAIGHPVGLSESRWTHRPVNRDCASDETWRSPVTGTRTRDHQRGFGRRWRPCADSSRRSEPIHRGTATARAEHPPYPPLRRESARNATTETTTVRELVRQPEAPDSRDGEPSRCSPLELSVGLPLDDRRRQSRLTITATDLTHTSSVSRGPHATDKTALGRQDQPVCGD